jgi:hypothetical protein
MLFHHVIYLTAQFKLLRKIIPKYLELLTSRITMSRNE